MADIGDTLGLLLPKMSLYAQDGAILETIIDELQLIKEACSVKRLDLSFFGLEFCRRSFPQHSPSMMEEQSVLFSALRCALGQKDDVQQAAQIFMEDPSALGDHRLPLFGSSRR